MLFFPQLSGRYLQFAIFFTSQVEVELAITRSINKKSSIPDGILNFILRKCTPTISEHLAVLFKNFVEVSSPNNSYS